MTAYYPRGGTAPALDQPYPGAPMSEVWRRFWKKGFTFTGRASRSEYWKFALVQLGVVLVIYFLLIAALVATNGSDAGGVMAVVLGVLIMLWLLATLVPSIALTIRRLHDANYPGTYYLFSFVPFVGSIIVLVMTIQESNPAGARFDEGATQVPYGYNPTPGWQVPPPQANPLEPSGYRPEAGYGQPPAPVAYGQPQAAFGQPPAAYGQSSAPYGQPPSYTQQFAPYAPPGSGVQPVSHANAQPAPYAQPVPPAQPGADAASSPSYAQPGSGAPSSPYAQSSGQYGYDQPPFSPPPTTDDSTRPEQPG